MSAKQRYILLDFRFDSPERTTGMVGAIDCQSFGHQFLSSFDFSPENKPTVTNLLDYLVRWADNGVPGNSPHLWFFVPNKKRIDAMFETIGIMEYSKHWTDLDYFLNAVRGDDWEGPRLTEGDLELLKTPERLEAYGRELLEVLNVSFIRGGPVAFVGENGVVAPPSLLMR